MKKIVVVEDEELVRQGIVHAVDWESIDCEVVGEASNGLAGLAVIKERKPDLIVADIKMPVMDGIDMVRALREEGMVSRVIFLTAYSDFSYAQHAVKLGAADYLLKPFRDGELEAAVRRAFESSRVPAAQEAPEPSVKYSRYVTEAIRYIESHFSEDISLSAVADHLGLSESRLSHLFKEETGQSPGSYLIQTRIRAAMKMLGDCRSKVYEVAEQTGFRDIAHFSSTFKKIVGMSPSDYQRSLPD
ncbi:MAG: response regulator [Oscillospiraceae bacterium]|nr:response regulator [Oscillospiraceae bacterium]